MNSRTVQKSADHEHRIYFERNHLVVANSYLIAPHRPTDLFAETAAESRMNVRLMTKDKRKAANLFSSDIN